MVSLHEDKKEYRSQDEQKKVVTLRKRFSHPHGIFSIVKIRDAFSRKKAERRKIVPIVFPAPKLKTLNILMYFFPVFYVFNIKYFIS